MPGVADLERSLAGKYGEPAARDKQDRYVSLVWSYDGGQGDLARCESHFEGEDGQENPAATFGAPRGPVDRAPNTFYSLKMRENISLRAMQGAFEGHDFYKIDFTGSSSDLSDDVNKFAHDIVPQILSNKGYPVRRTVPDQSYRGCGVQLHAVIMPTQTPGLNRKTTPTDVAWAMTISLSDQNALFVDDGVLAYMKAEVAKPAESGPKPPPKKEVF